MSVMRLTSLNRMTVLAVSAVLAIAGVLATGPTPAAWAKKPATQEVALTDTGTKLLERYTTLREQLQAELRRAVPFSAERKQAAVLLAAEQEAARKAAFPSVDARDDLLKDDRPGAIDDLLTELEQEEKAAQPKPKIDPKVETVLRFLRVLAAEAADKEDTYSARSKAFARKMDERLAEAAPLLAELEPLLSSDALDGKLAKFVLLTEATPRGLAAFAQQSDSHQQLVERLLADEALMVRMLLADGAKGGRYGRAMEIYTAIQNASTNARPDVEDGLFDRLALATSLEHAVPITQRNPAAKEDAPRTVDPVQRYLHYEKAYLDGELDSNFDRHTVWDYRMVVNGYEPDWALAWGREMLRNYRPDHITTPNDRWRYVASVRTDVRYGSQDNKFDRPELQFFQNILMNGGVCGRRAFFGRFILRAFGVPTIARPQQGHASLARWTPDGWSICLGGGWGGGWAGGSYNPDMNFLAITQARMADESYLKVKRALWLGDVMGEERVSGLIARAPDFWNGVGYYEQRAMVQRAKAITLAAVGEDIGEANESKVKEALTRATVTEVDRAITVAADGVITIPAVACSKPTDNTRKIKFMASNLGGMQLHYGRLGKPETFEYTFDAPAAGRYWLTARIVTPSWRQRMSLVVNDAAAPIEIPLPYTVGYWDRTQPVEITLKKGANRLRFTRNHAGLKGVSIKDFTLTPVAVAPGGEAAAFAAAIESIDPAMVALLTPSVQQVLEAKLSQTKDGTALTAACRALIDAYPQDHVLQKISLECLAALKGVDASGDLLTAMGSSNRWVRQFAREIAAELPEQGATQAWVALLNSAENDVRPEVLGVLSDRRDAAAAPAIRAYVDHEHEPTRTAALDALVVLGDPAGLAAVVKATADDSAAVRKQAYAILAAAPGASATEALIDLARHAKTDDANAIAVQHAFARVEKGYVPAAEKIKVIEQLVALARRPQDKQLAVAEILNMNPVAGLRLAQALLVDPVLTEGAGAAATQITDAFEDEDEQTIDVAVQVLRDVVRHVERPQTKAAAHTYIYRHRPPTNTPGSTADPASKGSFDLDSDELEF